MPIAAKMRFGGLNVLLHWAAYLIIVIMTVTGIFLYLGHGGWLIQVHSYTAFVGLAYVLIHAVGHYLQGGWWQVFRIFRPAKLVLTEAVKPKPLLIAAAVGIVIAAGIVATDWATRDTLVITKVEGEPKLDGILDEAMWNRARPVSIRTQQGENFGGSGESTVEVRAVHNGRKVFFAFKWTDPDPLAAPHPDGQEAGRLARRCPRQPDGRGRFLRRQARDHLLRQTRDRRSRRIESRACPPPRRQAAAAERTRLPFHHRRQLSSTCGSGRPRAAACSAASTISTSARRATRARTKLPTRRAIRAATGTIPAAPIYSYNYKGIMKGHKGPVEAREPAEGLEEGAGRARQVHARSEHERRRERPLEHQHQRHRSVYQGRRRRRFRSAP